MNVRRRRDNHPPWPIVVLGGIAAGVFVLPLIALVWRVPWSEVIDIVSDPVVRRALWVSVRTSVVSVVIVAVIGVPLAWVLATMRFPGRSLLRAAATVSMVLPPVVGGVALFASFGRRGLLGSVLDDWFGVRLPFSTAGVVMAQVFVSMPFLVLAVEGALRQVDARYADAASTLGATPWYTFRRVTLPAIRPALVAGLVLAWARALGEFGATITFAGNLPGRTQTMPLATYLALESRPDEALVLSLMMIVISFAVLIGLRDRWLSSPGTMP